MARSRVAVVLVACLLVQGCAGLKPPGSIPGLCDSLRPAVAFFRIYIEPALEALAPDNPARVKWEKLKPLIEDGLAALKLCAVEGADEAAIRCTVLELSRHLIAAATLYGLNPHPLIEAYPNGCNWIWNEFGCWETTTDPDWRAVINYLHTVQVAQIGLAICP